MLGEGAATFGDFESYTVAGGNAELARALAGELGGRIHLSSPVRRLRWDEEGVNVWTDSGELAARAAVIAIPTAPLAEIDFEPGASRADRRGTRLGALRAERQALRPPSSSEPAERDHVRAPPVLVLHPARSTR